MNTPKNVIMDSRTHGRARTFLVRTYGRAGVIPPIPPDLPEPVSGISNFIKNEVSAGYIDDTEAYHFTYSRNNGPIKHVVINMVHPVPDMETEEPDWSNELLEILNTLDNDLCRSQDGEGIAFYINVDQEVFPHQLLPKFDCKQVPQNVEQE